MEKAVGTLFGAGAATIVLDLEHQRPRPTVSMNPEGVDESQRDGASPSLNERIKSLAAGSGSPITVGRAHSGSPDTTKGSPSSSKHSKYVNAEDAFKARCLRELGPTLPADKRIAAAYEISKEIQLYSADALLDIWTVAEDLTAEKAPLETRKAGFALLIASVSHSGILKERERFYSMIATPVDASQANLQILALQRLTKDGQELYPFQAKLVLFLNHSLEGWFRTAERARKARAGSRSTKAEANKSIPNRTSGTGRVDDDFGRDISRKDSLKQSTLVEETSLLDAFYLVADILKHHPEAFHGDRLDDLIERVTSIALEARSRKYVRGTLKIFLAIIAKGQLPESALEPCIHVLCKISGIRETKFEEELWGCLSNLLTSNHKAATKGILLKLLVDPPNDSSRITVVRGALSTVQCVAKDSVLGGVLINDVQLLARGLTNVHTLDAQLDVDILKTINSLIYNEHVADAFGRKDWSALVKEFGEYLGGSQKLSTSEDADSSSLLCNLISGNQRTKGELTSGFSIELRITAERIMFLLQTDWESLDQQKLTSITTVLVHMALRVPTIWKEAINAMRIQGLLDPSNDNWMLHLRIVSGKIFANTSQSEDAGCLLLRILGELFPKLKGDIEKKTLYERCLHGTCEMLSGNTNLPISVLTCLAEVAVECGPDIENDTFQFLVNEIGKALKVSLLDPAVPAEGLDRTVDCLIKMFLRSLPQSSLKTRTLYDLILPLAAPSNPTTVRLKVIKLLTRLRCDAKEAIEVVSNPDSLDLASILCRTESTAVLQDFKPTTSNRTSTYEQPFAMRTGRSSVVDNFKTARSRSTTRSANFRERSLQPTHPLWMYDGPFKGLPEDPQCGPSKVVYSRRANKESPDALDLSSWLDIVIGILEEGSDWEVYSYILVHLPSQLSNRLLFARNVRQLQTMLNLVVAQVDRTGNRPFTTSLSETGIKQRDVVLCLYHILTMLLPYNQHFGRRELESTVRAFANGLDKWDGAGKCCIHALALCCHEIPSVIDKWMFNVIQKMQQKITQSDLAIDILEFLSGLAGLPDACSTATAKVPDVHSGTVSEDGGFYMTVFGICIRYLDYARDQRQGQMSSVRTRSSFQHIRQSVSANETAQDPQASQISDVQASLSEYVSALAYHVITSWFLAIEVSRRARHVGWITKGLACKDSSGNPMVEEQSQVILDMMHRTVFSDLGETQPDQRFIDPDEIPIRKTWLDGMSILTLEILPSSNSGLFTKRQVSGTTHASYYHNTAKMPEHHVRARRSNSSFHSQGLPDVYPNHMFLQISSTIAPLPIPLQPIVLPDNDVIQRALRNFDRTDTVDGHKAGVIYIGEGQSSEAEILANSQGTDAYEAFLSGLGTKVKLQDAKFNTQGLDRVSNLDGTETYAWRDRVTEIVFHVATMMPTDPENDSQGVKKKAHVGNDRVKIVYNDSGRAFNFDTFPSEMNFVNLVITPEAHTGGGRLVMARTPRGKATEDHEQLPSATELYGYYKVQTVCSSKFPQLSPAASVKVVSAEALPTFVRNMALNASLFCQIWSVVLGHGEYYSSWRVRLREIIRLRKEYANTNVSANVAYPLGPGPPPIYDGDSYTGVVSVGGIAEPDYFHMSLDFTRWT